MRKYNEIKSVVAVALVILANCLYGCSIIGYKAGQAIDNSINDKKSLTNWECAKIKEGNETTVHLLDGRAVFGEFGGLDKKPADVYNIEYTDFRRTNGGEFYLPEIGDTLRIRNWDGDQGTQEFLGFDYLYMGSGRSYKNHARALYTDISASVLDKKKEKNYPIKYLDQLETKDGDSVTGKELEELFSETTVPIRSRMVLQTNAGIEHVNFEEIHSVDVPRIKYARWIGLGLGVAIDAAVITVLVFLLTYEPVSLDGLRIEG